MESVVFGTRRSRPCLGHPAGRDRPMLVLLTLIATVHKLMYVGRSRPRIGTAGCDTSLVGDDGNAG